MIVAALTLLGGGAAGYLLWHLAEEVNAREAAEEINRVGGLNSPWASLEVPANVTATRQFWNELDRRYTPDEMLEIERDPMAGVSTPVSADVSTPASAPVSWGVSAPVSTSPTSQVQPAVEVVATTSLKTGCSDPAVEWLESHAGQFPAPLPPAKVESYADRMALAKASGWVAQAIAAGVSQNKVVTVVFGQSKGTATYDRIVELYRGLKDD